MNAADYTSFAEAWESRASIRTRPRRLLEDDDRLIYPLSRQPLVSSESFLTLCPEQRDFVLLQSLYKFINDVVISRPISSTAPPAALPRGASRSPFRLPVVMTP